MSLAGKEHTPFVWSLVDLGCELEGACVTSRLGTYRSTQEDELQSWRVGPDVLASHKQVWLRLLQCWLMRFSLNCWLSRAEAKPPLGWACGGEVQEQAVGQAVAVMGVTVSKAELRASGCAGGN